MIAKVSKGTNMDQIYIPKNKINPGTYVQIEEIEPIELHYHNIDYIEPIKIEIIKKIFAITKHTTLITGSFLNKGMKFNDIDVIIISEKINYEEELKEVLGEDLHLIVISKKELDKGIATDPLFCGMISKYISSKNIAFNVKREINPELLDMHLLTSKSLIDTYEYLTVKERYKQFRNFISIKMFLDGKNISEENAKRELNIMFDEKFIEYLLDNTLEPNKLRKKYKQEYNKIQQRLFDEAKARNKSNKKPSSRHVSTQNSSNVNKRSK
ncbi:hypothetical protein H6503_00320 [Candidatus Woesearchaeota archaeon]|nr:hypothetical protein [Candidatus Woesearchaeota archaeon]